MRFAWELLSLYESWINPEKLYNIVADRTELHNLHDKDARLVASMEKQYAAWAERVGVLDWHRVPPRLQAAW